MRRRGALVFLAAFLAAGVMTLADVRVASPQTIVLAAPRADGPVPADPWDGVWDRATAVDIPLSAQSVTRPIGGAGGAVTARAMHDGRRLYLLLQWRDHTEDRAVGKPQLYADQAAVEFPTAHGNTVPSFCMGDPQATVDVWIWKASRQADADQGYRDVQGTYPSAVSDLYPFADEDVFYPPRALGNVVAATTRRTVESLVAGGFGSLTASDPQAVDGRGRWRRDGWRVLFTRELAAPGDGQVTFAVPETTNVAFAVWNGSRNERDGLKSVSQFVSLQLTERALGPAQRSSLIYVLIGIAGLLMAAGLILTPLLFARRGARSDHGDSPA